MASRGETKLPPLGGPNASGQAPRVRLRWPKQAEHAAPCQLYCGSGGDVRSWIGLIAQREAMGLGEDEAIAEAWNALVEANPFPATLGRVCPHPCEDRCSRKEKDGGVAIHSMERFLGDWALDRELRLPRKGETLHAESVGAVGAGPSGLSFAYQMARRGYGVTVYERLPKAGGMLQHGIPVHRLPEEVLAAEIQRILDLGVELKLGVALGRDVTVEQLRRRHRVLYLGIGAQAGRRLGVAGEEGPSTWLGTDYLRRVNAGEVVELGARVAVVGGGNTAVDAARAARRGGAEVTLVYRRTREEMPAFAGEIEDAIRENVQLEFLAAPAGIQREEGRVRAILLQRMSLGEPDASGRRRPLPVPGSQFELEIDSVIAAVSQEPDWAGLGELSPGGAWLSTNSEGKLRDRVWAGGDVRGLGIAGAAIAHGRAAAEAVHAELRGMPPPGSATAEGVPADRLRHASHPSKPRAEDACRPVGEWLSRPDEEINRGISRREFLEEAARCYSCGSCSGCQRCWMYCNASAFTRLEQPRPGAYYSLSLDACEGCGKCIELCPSGFLEEA